MDNREGMRSQAQRRAAAAVALLALCGCATTESIPERITLVAYPSVVTVAVLDQQDNAVGQGGGVVIAERIVATTCRVAERGGIYEIKQRKKNFPALLYFADRERDVCLLQAMNISIQPALRGEIEDVRAGQKVYTVSAAEGGVRAVHEGTLVAVTTRAGVEYLQTDAASEEKLPGGGLFDGNGKLIGMITLVSSDQGKKHSFAIPVNRLAELLQRAKAQR